MGTWGAKLYQDDIAEDVRSYYKDQLKRGKTNEEATNKLIQDNQDIIEDEGEASVFWFSLADMQWSLGRLLPFVKEKALEYLRKGYDLERWKGENSKEYLIRKKVLEELEIKINTNMPPEKKILQYKIYKCEWKTGDVFAYKLDGDYAIRNGFKDRYLIVYKIDESTWWPGHTIPVVYLKLSQQCEIPKSKDDIEGCEFIKTTFARKKPEYRVQLLSTSRKVIPQNKLTLVGNFTNLSTPGDEYIISDKIYTATCNWSDLEEFAIESYLKIHKS